MIFQGFNLLMQRTCQRNVAFPLELAGMKRGDAMKRAAELLELVGMKERMLHKPEELSGGQKQRTAIARAMANDPSIILADEPTGALDSETSRRIMDIFHRLHREQGKTIVLITHSTELAQETDRVVKISDGRILAE